jgi:hypothetical protein
MYAVAAPKKNKNVLSIRVDPFARRGRPIKKGGAFGDKRRKARVNDRAWKSHC